jgi:hypothetical protein
MGRVVLIVAAVLALTACGAGPEVRPAGSTESSQTEALPDIARVVCQAGSRPQTETPAVKPQRDGVHIRFVNETGMDLAFSIEDPSEGGIGLTRGKERRPMWLISIQERFRLPATTL